MYICIVIFGFCIFFSTLCIMFMFSFFTLCFSSCIFHMMFMCLCTVSFSKNSTTFSNFDLSTFSNYNFSIVKFGRIDFARWISNLLLQICCKCFFCFVMLWGGGVGFFVVLSKQFVVCKIQVFMHLQFTNYCSFR